MESMVTVCPRYKKYDVNRDHVVKEYCVTTRPGMPLGYDIRLILSRFETGGTPNNSTATEKSEASYTRTADPTSSSATGKIITSSLHLCVGEEVQSSTQGESDTHLAHCSMQHASM